MTPIQATQIVNNWMFSRLSAQLSISTFNLDWAGPGDIGWCDIRQSKYVTCSHNHHHHNHWSLLQLYIFRFFLNILVIAALKCCHTSGVSEWSSTPTYIWCSLVVTTLMAGQHREVERVAVRCSQVCLRPRPSLERKWNCFLLRGSQVRCTGDSYISYLPSCSL